ncbi:MAG: YigZ family protein [Anaerolineaceae bacterium]
MNQTSYRIIPLEPVETEVTVVNSRFIASLSPVKSVEEAREFQKVIKARYPDASHHVPAFVIGHGNSTISHSNDDGEPSGTAGRPALAVLSGSGLGNVCVVVTRYFGGTKLGTGGLVRAYGDAVKAVLLLVRRARLVPTSTWQFAIDYPLYEQTLRLIHGHAGEVVDTQFEVEVCLTVRFKDEDVESFTGQLKELSAGKVKPLMISRESETPFPL